MSDSHQRVLPADLQAFVERAFRSVGLPAATAHVAAGALVETDSLGVFTHGTKLLAGYLHKLQGGGYVA
ncbi:MAG: Ldh family oxidoreductase, partial [Planctomycetaceae bacterium]